MIISNGYAIEFAFGMLLLELRPCLMDHRFMFRNRSIYNFSTKDFVKKVMG